MLRISLNFLTPCLQHPPKHALPPFYCVLVSSGGAAMRVADHLPDPLADRRNILE